MPKGQTARSLVNDGGRQPADARLFELNAGALCLDLANTVEKRPAGRARRDLLREYADLVDWGVQAGAISAQAGRRLRAAAAGHSAAASRALTRARDAREAIFDAFAAVVRRQPASARCLDRLNRPLSLAMGHLRIHGRGRDLAFDWDDTSIDLDRIVWPALKSAGELLTSPRRDRVRLCAAPECDWLFLDQSKNGTRRWCDMTVCGNRAKARRFYRRHHEPA